MYRSVAQLDSLSNLLAAWFPATSRASHYPSPPCRAGPSTRYACARAAEVSAAVSWSLVARIPASS